MRRTFVIRDIDSREVVGVVKLTISKNEDLGAALFHEVDVTCNPFECEYRLLDYLPDMHQRKLFTFAPTAEWQQFTRRRADY